ncbi:large conductance mechanosensitive channel protein MscL [Streptomyces sp. YIM 98790]|uniref:large conductance mechanosensitive channel protein MscL n=1 Tax=Streptomyces sp. YIM 98790 TaxID=2689077 RepID=UPI0028BD3DDF|nr:large conductance mechanosensitive channel protein MscL [Streptomyces sp. YIM 98790]
MSDKQNVLHGFRDFIMRGNVVDLAVAVVIGAAFTKVVNTVVEGMINPLIGAFGTQDLEVYTSCLKGPCETVDGETVGILIRWGSVISAGLTFLLTAAVVYFLMILPMTRLKARLDARKPQEESPAAKTELDILTEIRDELVARRTGAPVPAAAGEGPDAAGDASGNGSGRTVAPPRSGS